MNSKKTLFVLISFLLIANVGVAMNNPVNRDSLYAPLNLDAISDIGHIVLDWDEPGPVVDYQITEGFENTFPPVGWTVDGINTDDSQITPSYFHQEDYEFLVYNGSYSCGLWGSFEPQDEWLITPQFTAGDTTFLEFWCLGLENSPYGGHYYVKVSDNGGATWDVVLDLTELAGDYNTYEYPYQIDLSEYAGQDIKIAWNVVQALSVFFIDDVRITVGDSVVTFDEEASFAEQKYPIIEENRLTSSFEDLERSKLLSDNNKEIMEILHNRNISRNTLTGYEITRTDPLGNLQTFQQAPDLTEYMDEELDLDIRYKYFVKAIYEEGTSGESNPDSAIAYSGTVFCPTENLTAQFNDTENTIDLSWEEPPDCTTGWLHWDWGNGYNYYGINLDTLVVAIRFDAQDMEEHIGNYLTKIKTVFNHPPDYHSYTFKIWEGGSYGDPGNLIYSQEVTEEYPIGFWATIELDEPIQIHPEKEYWVGCRLSCNGGEVACMYSTDEGPVVPEKGLWVLSYAFGWAELNFLWAEAMDKNWAIRCLVSDEIDGEPTTIIGSKENTREDDAIGYQVWRKEGESDYELLTTINDPQILNYSDSQIVANTEYSYYIVATYTEGISKPGNTVTVLVPNIGISDDGISPLIPNKFTLEQNYPNPFNPHTLIKFTVPEKTDVSIKIYDITGKLIKALINEEKEAGYHSVVWDGKDAAGKDASSGVYLYGIESKSFNDLKQMMLIR